MLMIEFPYRSPQAIDLLIEEFFDPGRKAEVVLELHCDLSPDDVTKINTALSKSGLRIIKPICFGFTAEWPRALHLEFIRPTSVRGVACIIFSALTQLTKI